MNCCKVGVHVGMECIDISVGCKESGVISIENVLCEFEAMWRSFM